MVEEGLAVVAVAHDPVNGVGRDTRDQPANLAAATGQRVPAHFLLRRAVAGPLFPPPALRECRHRSLARGRITVGRHALLVMPEGERPHPQLADRRGVCLKEFGRPRRPRRALKLVVVPLARGAGSRGAFKCQVVLFHYQRQRRGGAGENSNARAVGFVAALPGAGHRARTATGEWDTLICRVPVSTRPIMTTAPASMQIVINRLLRSLCITKGPPLVERRAPPTGALSIRSPGWAQARPVRGPLDIFPQKVPVFIWSYMQTLQALNKASSRARDQR